MKLLILFAVVLGVVNLAAGQARPPDEDATTKTRQLLERLELDRFQIALLEPLLIDKLDRAPDRDVAAQLAQLYLKQIHTAAEEGREATEYHTRLKQLLVDFPSVDQPLVRVGIIYGDFARLEAKFRAAVSAPGEPEPTSAALKTYEDVRRLIAEARPNRTPAASPSPAEPSIEFKTEPDTAVQQNNALELQLNYLAAWADYYGGVLVADAATKDQRWSRADNHFREILQLQLSLDLTDVQEDWLELSSGVMARTALGLALCEQALQKENQAAAFFRLLELPSTYPPLRRQLTLWRLNSFLYAGEIESLQAWLSPKNQSVSQVSIDPAALTYVAEYVSRLAAADPSKKLASAELAEFLSQRLIERNQMSVLDDWVARGLVVPDTFRNEFTKHLVMGRRLFLAAEKSTLASDFAAAQQQLDQAIALGVDPLTPGQHVQVVFLRVVLVPRGQVRGGRA